MTREEIARRLPSPREPMNTHDLLTDCDHGRQYDLKNFKEGPEEVDL